MQNTLPLECEEGKTGALRLPSSIQFDLDNFKDKGSLTHNFHPYPAKFVPHIPRLVISALSEPGDTVLDPFCGSGTTLVESALLGRPSVGFDVNELSCLMSRVKTQPLCNSQWDHVQTALMQVEALLLSVLQGKTSVLECAPLPEFKNRDHWFQPHIVHELAAIRICIDNVQDAAAREFLKVAFSSLIVKVSNQDSDTRWVAVQKNVPQGTALRMFVTKVRDMKKRLEEFGKRAPKTTVVREHSVTESFPLPSDSVGLVVTSPPYPNSFDYYLYHKLRFFWLGMDHYKAQRKEIGSRNRHSDNGESIESFADAMSNALREVYRVLRPAGYACFVVGDSIIKGEKVDMKTVYDNICEAVGFLLSHTFSYDQRRYTSAFLDNLQTGQKQSHIMFLQKPL